MACVCKNCLEHSRTLGIAQTPTSKSAIHKAYRTAAKLWHPDRFENNQRKRLEAEERFKGIHFAYQELCAHFQHPERLPRDTEFVTPIRPQPRPEIFFGDAPACFAAPNFPPHVHEAIIATRLENSETPVGFIDMSTGSNPASRYILLTNHRMYIRDSTDILSVIWYADIGEIRLVDLQTDRKPGKWQRIVDQFVGRAQQYSLEINHLNGARFRELNRQPDDRIKKVVYNFLRQMKSHSQS
jgi:DnaJ domain